MEKHEVANAVFFVLNYPKQAFIKNQILDEAVNSLAILFEQLLCKMKTTRISLSIAGSVLENNFFSENYLKAK